MPVHVYAILLVSVIAAAGVTVAVVFNLGVGFAWLGLGALVLAVVVRKVRL